MPQSLKIPLRSSCQAKKIRYYSRLVAEEHRISLEKLDRANGVNRGALVVYACRLCRAFHVGHMSI